MLIKNFIIYCVSFAKLIQLFNLAYYLIQFKY